MSIRHLLLLACVTLGFSDPTDDRASRSPVAGSLLELPEGKTMKPEEFDGWLKNLFHGVEERRHKLLNAIIH